MKVLSLNLHCGKEKDYEEKLKHIIETCRALEADLIFFQECVQSKDAKIVTEKHGLAIKADNLGYQIRKALLDLGLDYDYYFDWGKYGFEVLEEGLCILSRYPILGVESRYVSKSKSIDDWKARKIIGVEVDVDCKRVFAYNGHFSWWKDGQESFEQQFLLLNEWIKEKQGIHIIAGDFNNAYGTKGYDLMMDLAYKDLYLQANPNGAYDATFVETNKQASIESSNINKRIDFILSPSASVECKEMTIIFRDPMVSDHYGLFGDINID